MARNLLAETRTGRTPVNLLRGPVSGVAGAGAAGPDPNDPTRRLLSVLVQQGRETLSEENIGRVLGMAAAPGLGTAGALATAARSLPVRAAVTGGATLLGDVGQQAGEAIRGEREAIDPQQAAIAGALGGGGQAAGELIGAAVPAATRFLFRGGERGRQGVQQAIDDLEPFGVSPSAAVATQRPGVDVIETIASRTPGGRAPLARAAEKTAQAVQDRIEQTATRLTGGRISDPEAAGIAVGEGLEQAAQRFSNRADRAFSRINEFVDPAARVPVSNTSQMLDELTAPIQGAEETSELLTQPFITRFRERFAADAVDGALPFESIQRLRSFVGRRLNDPSLISDVPRGELKRLYGALSEDIGAAATASGPRAAGAFNRANRFYRLGRERIDKTLDPLTRKNVPEQIFRTLERGAQEGPTQIRRVMRSLNQQQRNAVSAALIRRMGRATPSQQQPDSDVFSFETFLTNWDKMRRSGGLQPAFQHNLGLFRDMEKIARTAGRIRESSQAFRNPPGTAGALIGQGLTLGAVASAAMGAPKIALGLGAAALSANATARLLTNPKFVRWLAQADSIKPSGMAAHIGRLEGIAESEDVGMQAAVRELLGQLQ